MRRAVYVKVILISTAAIGCSHLRTAGSDTAATLGTPAGAAAVAPTCSGPPDEDAATAQARLSSLLLNAALAYARDNAHPTTGFVLDTVPNYADVARLHPPTDVHVQRASISSTGFMMALVADLYRKGVVGYDEAYAYCRRPLAAVIAKKAADLQASSLRHTRGAVDPQTALTKFGWFSHFLNWETGDRWEKSEYAVTDTSWFLAGALVCADTFPDTELEGMARAQIYGDVDFVAMMTNGGASPTKQTLALSYAPETGFSPHDWVIYQHSWLAYLLGMGTPNAAHRMPNASWAAWDRTGAVLSLADPELNGKTLYGNRRALFSHYFPDVFVDPRSLQEVCGIDYFANSVTAAKFNLRTAANDATSQTFTAGFWGIDAGPNPQSSMAKPAPGTPPSVGAPHSEAYGVNTPLKHNGTACLACAMATAEFIPTEAFASLRTWCNDPRTGGLIWGTYGPSNGVNLDFAWLTPFALSGIVGPMALSVANLDDKTSIWGLLAADPSVQLALAQAKSAPPPEHGCLIPEGQH